MATQKPRSFESTPATRSRGPLWIGLVGPSGSGKTFSALRLATGMAKVYGDDVSVIDSEARRAAHYASDFRFLHLDFKAPFGPDDYAGAIQHCLAKGARTVVIDSMSHEWDGAGGVLEQHEAECERLVQQWSSTRDKVQMAAWQRPKSAHRRLLNEMLQSGANFILCYRAKEKLKVVQGKPPVPLGWQPVAPDDFVYEATVNILLYPGSGGVPRWQPDEAGEKALIKLPGYFAGIFKDRRPLDEATGEALARWAAGGAPGPAPSVPTAVPDAAPPAGKATRADLKTLTDQLMKNGLTDPTARGVWIITVIGRSITRPDELTAAEVNRCLQAAKERA